MEANKDEALHALGLAKKHLAATPPNIATARKLALKSVALCETSEAFNLLERIRILEEKSTESNGRAEAHASGAEAFAGSEGVKHRNHSTSSASAAGATTHNGPSSAKAKGKGRDDEKREYTAEQLTIVKRIRKCKVTEYYEILSLKKDCDESDIKRAYRKVCDTYIPNVPRPRGLLLVSSSASIATASR
jgi:DnaJ homolog subfamily B member 12